MTSLESFITHFHEIFRLNPLIYTHETKRGSETAATSIVYENIPGEGMITGLSFGLSESDYADWDLERPELMITVRSTEMAWGLLPGFLANELRGKHSFNHGHVIDLETTIANDSEMSAFFIFAPHIALDDKLTAIDIGEKYKIYMAGLCPIYKEEIEVFRQIGLE